MINSDRKSVLIYTCTKLHHLHIRKHPTPMEKKAVACYDEEASDNGFTNMHAIERRGSHTSTLTNGGTLLFPS